MAFTNFALADVSGGLMPFLVSYLVALGWQQGEIGLVIATMSITGLLAQTPMGAWVDGTKQKRLLLSGAALVVALTFLSVVFFPFFWPVIIAKGVMGAAAAVFVPAIGAITLGIWGPEGFTAQIGRNQAFNHLGNVSTALVAGVLGYTLGLQWPFYLAVVSALLSVVAITWIPRHAIDDEQARAMGTDKKQAATQPSGLGVLLKSKLLLIFALCILLFHFANAAMLPLVTGKLAQSDPSKASLYVSICIALAQVVMIPMAILVGCKADKWGRKPIFLIGFMILPIRGVLYTFSDNAFYLMGVQLLDGIGAGIYGALVFIVIRDLTRGTGRYNMAQGAVLTLMGIGVSLSNLITGYIAEWVGFNAAFYFLSLIAGLALLLFWLAMPETLDIEPQV